MEAAAPRVLVVDDDVRYRDLLSTVLEQAGFHIVATAANGAEALELAAAHAPDAVTMDLEMPVLDGVGATAALVEAHPGVVVVVVSGSASREKLAAALAAGAIGHVPKRDASGDLPQALHAALATAAR